MISKSTIWFLWRQDIEGQLQEIQKEQQQFFLIYEDLQRKCSADITIFFIIK